MMNDSKSPLVTIQCMAYNHEPYIRQCLAGFVMQRTNFRFEAIVHDDASTDGTAAIIKEFAEKYPEIIKPIFEKENLYSKGDGSILQVMEENSCGKYVAICEGDDYWIDPLKLQKQVDFLEQNLHFSLVYTDYIVENEKGERLLVRKPDFISGKCTERLLQGENPIATLTVMYRQEYMTDYIEFLRNIPFRLLFDDKVRWIWHSTKGMIGFINEKTSVRRVLRESASFSDNFFGKPLKLCRNIEAFDLYANQYFNVGVPEQRIKKEYAKLRTRISMKYSFKTFICQLISEYKAYPWLILSPRMAFYILTWPIQRIRKL